MADYAIAVGHVYHPDHCWSVERRVVSIRMRLEIGRHAHDRLPKVVCAEVFERRSFAPSEMLIPRQCGPSLTSSRSIQRTRVDESPRP